MLPHSRPVSRATSLQTWKWMPMAARMNQTALSASKARSNVLHHVILSGRPGESVSEDVARSAVDATIQSLDAEEHQWYAAMHRDAERVHVHIGINRVEPICGNWKRMQLTESGGNRR